MASVLLTKYYSGDQKKKNEIGRAFCNMGQERCKQDFGGEPGGKKSLGRPRHRWKDNIKMDLKGMGWGGAWTGLMWHRIGTGGRHLSMW